jgi:hypothetical protein
MAYNPYTSIAQMQAENQQMMQQLYGGGYQPPFFQPQQAAPAPVRRRGEYVEVASEQEMQAASVRMDGTPTLFIDFGQKLLWSKKYANGKVELDVFRFDRPEFSTVQSSDDIEIVEDTDGDKISAITERLNKLETAINGLVKKGRTKNETVDQQGTGHSERSN